MQYVGQLLRTMIGPVTGGHNIRLTIMCSASLGQVMRLLYSQANSVEQPFKSLAYCYHILLLAVCGQSEPFTGQRQPKMRTSRSFLAQGNVSFRGRLSL